MTDGTPLRLRRLEAYDALLHEAGEVAGRAVGRLRDLHDRFPDAVPDEVLDGLRHAQRDPRGERRAAVRLAGTSGRASVRTDLAPPAEARVLDRSPGGLRLRVGRPLVIGTVVEVRLTGDRRWYPAQVRYCRPAPVGCIAGCEFAAERPG